MPTPGYTCIRSMSWVGVIDFGVLKPYKAYLPVAVLSETKKRQYIVMCRQTLEAGFGIEAGVSGS